MFHNLRVKYPHLVSSSQSEQNSFLKRQKIIRAEKLKQEQSEIDEQIKIKKAWIAYLDETAQLHQTGRYKYYNEITGEDTYDKPVGPGVNIKYKAGA